MLNDPNQSGDLGKDISGRSHDWLAGQLVDLAAVVWGPPEMTRFLSYNWTVPGSTLYSYSDTATNASETLLKAANTYSNVPGNPFGATFGSSNGVGTSKAEVQFFWVHTAVGGPDSESVSVQVRGLTAFPQPVWTETSSTSFQLYEPNSTFSVVGQGSTYGPYANPEHGGQLWVRLLRSNNGVAVGNGITIDAGVSTPAAFAAGKWKAIQLATPNITETLQPATGGPEINRVFSGNAVRGLDSADPYDSYQDVAAGPFIFPTGNTDHLLVDTPGSPVAPIGDAFTPGVYHVADLSRSDGYEDYLMFLPPGSRSNWVPLNYQDWYWSFTLTRNLNGTYIVTDPRGPAPGDPSAAFDEPLWSVNQALNRMVPV